MSNIQKISGIVCEFNPLHYGHKYIIDKAKEHGTVVCVMSGNYVQRGENAIMDKWSRTELALKSGASLVLELPLPYAVSGAEHFAAAAVHILDSLGVEGSIVFGSECGDSKTLADTAKALLSPELKDKILQRGSFNQTYAAIRANAISELFGSEYADIIRNPNNILGTEYIKALITQNSNLVPITVKRSGSPHDTDAKNGEIMSASQLREFISAGNPIKGLVPDITADMVKRLASTGALPSELKKLEVAILSKLKSINAEGFRNVPDISEGLEYKIYESAQKALTLDQLIDGIKTKRYTHARIRRIIISAFLGITADLPYLPPYIRVLGMDEQGAKLLSSKNRRLPLCIRSKDFETLGGDSLRLFRLEAYADDVYSLSFPTPQPSSLDYKKAIVKI